MKNIFKSLITVFAIALIFVITSQKAFASDQTAETSAVLASSQNVQVAKQDNRAEILSAYLKQFNSPLADHADTFIKEADANNLDWRMVAAISGVESGYGKAIPAYSYNAWGFGVYGSNVRGFTSWDDGITVVSTALRVEYMNARGATNVYQIGATYAASPTWASRVQGNMDSIEQFSENYSPKPALSISL